VLDPQLLKPQWLSQTLPVTGACNHHTLSSHLWFSTTSLLFNTSTILHSLSFCPWSLSGTLQLPPGIIILGFGYWALRSGWLSGTLSHLYVILPLVVTGNSRVFSALCVTSPGCSALPMIKTMSRQRDHSGETFIGPNVITLGRGSQWLGRKPPRLTPKEWQTANFYSQKRDVASLFLGCHSTSFQFHAQTCTASNSTNHKPYIRANLK
jgi:hypothetical protein